MLHTVLYKEIVVLTYKQVCVILVRLITEVFTQWNLHFVDKIVLETAPMITAVLQGKYKQERPRENSCWPGLNVWDRIYETVS